MEKHKYENRRRMQAPPAPPQGPQMDYDLSQEQAKAEERRAYQDYMVGVCPSLLFCSYFIE